MLAMRAMCDEAAHDHELQAEDADEYEYDLFRDLGTLKFGQDANGVEIGAEQTEDIGGDDDDVDSERPRRPHQRPRLEPRSRLVVAGLVQKPEEPESDKEDVIIMPLLDEKMQYAKMEPVVTVLDVPGTWRWA